MKKNTSTIRSPKKINASHWLWIFGRLIISIVLVLIFFTPFLWMLLGSFRQNAEIMSSIKPFGIGTFLPTVWTLENYADVMGLTLMGKAQGLNALGNLANSGIVSISVVTLSLTTSTLAAYVFSETPLSWKGNCILDFSCYHVYSMAGHHCPIISSRSSI